MADFILNAETGHIGAGGFVQKIFHMKIPNLERFRFEWHPEKLTVYAITIGILPEMAEPIAHDVDTDAQALRIVNAWAHGFSSALYYGGPS